MGWSKHSSWNYSYHGIDSTHNVNLLTYKNTGTIPQLITACKIGLATGNGTYNANDVVTGYGYAYDVYVTATDSNGTSHQSDTITVSNKTSGGNTYNVETKTFKFGGIYVAAGSTITFQFHFIRKTSPTVIIIRDRNDSSTFGGTVIDGGGLVRINVDGTTSGWKSAIPYINIDGTASGWRVAIPYINKDGTSNGWSICT